MTKGFLSKTARAWECAGSASSICQAGISRFSTKTSSVWVVFNGEIYNFPELRAELEKRGHHFYTQYRHGSNCSPV